MRSFLCELCFTQTWYPGPAAAPWRSWRCRWTASCTASKRRNLGSQKNQCLLLRRRESLKRTKHKITRHFLQRKFGKPVLQIEFPPDSLPPPVALLPPKAPPISAPEVGMLTLTSPQSEPRGPSHCKTNRREMREKSQVTKHDILRMMERKRVMITGLKVR